MDRLYVQIVTDQGVVCRIPGGGILERDLIQIATDAILENCSAPLWAAVASGLKADLVDQATAAVGTQRVGMFTTKARVLAHVRAQLAETLDGALRAKRLEWALPTYVTHGEVRATIADGMHRAIQTLKDDSRYVVESI